MREFFKMFGASLAALVVAFMIFFSIISGVVSLFSVEVPSTPRGSVLVINLDENITDSPRMPEVLMDTSSSFGLLYSLSMYEVMTALETAATDPTISAVYINASGVGSFEGHAQIEEMRSLLKTFKENSGKPVIAYQDTYSQEQYWLSSVADEVYLNPAGGIDWRGVASQSLFFKGAIDKLGVDVQVVRHGTFKAAVEPYILSEMSKENRLQTKTMVDSMWAAILGDVSSSRNISAPVLDDFANNLAITSAQKASSLGFVDGLVYEDEVHARLAEMLNKEEVNFITLGEYCALLGPSPYSKNKIAIIYADGEIVDGYGMEGIVGGITTVDQIRRAREDKSIKGVVLRVNSPGGSALASEVIWRELELLQREKPLVVSMSNYAASGGYYISSPADAIYTNRTTLTGSIGVFGLMISGGKALEEGLGVTAEVVKSNDHSDMGSLFRTLSEKELTYMQNSVEEVYDTFVGRVSKGRGMDEEDVRSIGEGRVWCGCEAVYFGLADKFGGLREAICEAALLAGVENDYTLVEVLEEEVDILSMLSSLLMAKAPQMEAISDELSTLTKALEGGTTIFARMPYNIRIY